MLFTLKLYKKNLEDVFTSAILNKWELNRWFRSKGGLSVHTCRPGHAYFVSSFIPKFWGCVTILIRWQYNRTGQVCVHIHVQGRWKHFLGGQANNIMETNGALARREIF